VLFRSTLLFIALVLFLMVAIDERGSKNLDNVDITIEEVKW